jgi:hypothetical protein
VEPGVTSQRIKAGMTEKEVRELLGAPKEEIAFGAATRWTYPDLTVVFEGGRVKEVRSSGGAETPHPGLQRRRPHFEGLKSLVDAMALPGRGVGGGTESEQSAASTRSRSTARSHPPRFASVGTRWTARPPTVPTIAVNHIIRESAADLMVSGINMVRTWPTT